MFSYFVPNNLVSERTGKPTLVGIDQPMLESLGLGHVGKVTAKQITIGPSGAGWLLYRDGYDACDQYLVNAQTWQPMPFPSDIWIGYNTVKGLPGPKHLARSEQLPGALSTLGDDRKWLIPAAIQYDDDGIFDCRLPRSLKVGSDGQWGLGDVLPKYKKLWTLLEKYLEAESTAVDGKFVFSEINDWFVTAIACNYYIGAAEASILGLLNQHNRNVFVEAILDIATRRDILQKKSLAHVTGDLSDGLSASTTDSPATTDQPTPTGSPTPTT
jgi:hypothetical protein